MRRLVILCVIDKKAAFFFYSPHYFCTFAPSYGKYVPIILRALSRRIICIVLVVMVLIWQEMSQLVTRPFLPVGVMADLDYEVHAVTLAPGSKP